MIAKNKIIIGASLTVGLTLIIGVSIIITKNKPKEEVVYRETTVQYGDLSVGIGDESSVQIGTIEQKFELDISALVESSSSGTSTSNSSSSMPSMGSSMVGGMMPGMSSGGNSGGMSSMMSFGSFGNSVATQSQSMEIESVEVSVGQEIKAGDVMYTLTQNSVNNIRTNLAEDTEDTLNDYEALQIEQQASRVQAKQGYDTYVTNGKYAQIIYDSELLELQENVDKATKEVNDKQDEYNKNLLKLEELTSDYSDALVYLQEAEGAVAANKSSINNNFEDAYYYILYENTRETAQKLVDQLEEEIESLNENNEKIQEEIDAAMRSLNQANLDYEKGKLDLKQTYDVDAYYSKKSSEWYSIQTASLDNELSQSLLSYNQASEKLAEFDTYVVDNKVLAEYNGVITEVPLSSGDKITGNTSLITLYDQTDVSMEVSIGEADYEAIDKSGKVNIVLEAYPDEVYQGTISEVSDAEYDNSSGKVYYTITVDVLGDVSGFYEGMTGNITFVTKETKKVTNVSNRAIYRKGTKSYVKMYDEAGNIVEKEVVTGFSDGVNVEIVDGLSEGEVVLIESVVS